MTEKEFPIFAFEERRRFGVSMQESKNDIEPLEIFLQQQKIELKASNSVLKVFLENTQQQIIRGKSSFYQVIRYKNHILLEFLIELDEYDDIDKFCIKIENGNKLFLEKGREGIKKIIKLLMKSKPSQDIFTIYDYDAIWLLYDTKNPIQVEKTEQEQTLKITYKIDL